jgi:hypothetical protein
MVVFSCSFVNMSRNRENGSQKGHRQSGGQPKVAYPSSLLKNAGKTSPIGRDALCCMTLESSEPIGKEKDHDAIKCGQSTRKQPKRRQRGLVLALDDACLLVFSASASDFAPPLASRLHN